MQGHKHEKKGRVGYYELVVETNPDPVTGERRQVRKGYRAPGATKRAREAAADKRLRELVTEVEQGRYRSTDVTLGYLLDEWLGQAELDRAATTIHEYRRLVKKRIKPKLGKVPLSQLGADRLDAFYRDLRQDGLSTGSVRQVHAIIRRALNQALDWEWISASPAVRAGKNLSVHRREMSPPSPAELNLLLEKARKSNPELAAFLRLKAGVGARRGELCGLRHSDYTPVSGTGKKHRKATLLIARSVAVVAGETIIKDTKTHQARRPALGVATAAALEEHLRRMAERAAGAGVELVPDPYIFSARLDGSSPWHPDHVTKAFVQLRKKLKIRGRLHDLRHMHATELGGKGVPVRTIADRLGHAQPSTTLNMYSHALRANDEEAAEEIDEILAPDAQRPPAEAGGEEVEGAG